MYSQYLSNVHIDNFVEKISTFGVKPDDINDYLQYSVQYESIESFDEKQSLIDSMFFDFQVKYPELDLQLQDDINQVYINVGVFGQEPNVDVSRVFDKIRKEISDKLDNLPFSGDFFDLGAEIGMIATEYINDKKFGLRKEDFIGGIKHGIKMFEQ